MAAQRRTVGVAAVLEEVKQPFLVHQALGERQVAFLVLRGRAAFRIDALVGAVEAPGRRQLALALTLIGAEHRIEDVEHVHVLEDAAVAAVGQEGGPGLDGEGVARANIQFILPVPIGVTDDNFNGSMLWCEEFRWS
jgi:hypothetical protein